MAQVYETRSQSAVMTVGIAAIADSQSDPCVVVAADRMVTVGEQGGIEFEGNESKLAAFIDNGELSATAVGAGSTTFIDEILVSFDDVTNNLEFEPTTTRDALSVAQAAYKMTIRETIQNQVLSPLGYYLEDLRNDDVKIPAQIQSGIFEQATNLRQQIAENVHILIAAAGSDGGGVFVLAGGDFNNYTRMGYWVVGSGADSAGLSLIRRQYNHRSPLREGIFTVIEAKDQAEERQGVGQQMDMIVAWPSNIYEFDENDKRQLRQKLGKIQEEEKTARENVMEEWEKPFS